MISQRSDFSRSGEEFFAPRGSSNSVQQFAWQVQPEVLVTTVAVQRGLALLSARKPKFSILLATRALHSLKLRRRNAS